LLPFKVLERIVEKPLRIKGLAIAAGVSRNLNIYSPEELQSFAGKLVSAPVYLEHVAAPNAVGKIVKTDWDGQNLWYEAEIYDDETAERIRKGLIKHVSIGADYETVEILDGKIPHGLHNAEMSLVAVPGVPETNIQVMEKLQIKEQAYEPMIAGEYILGFCKDISAFLPEHFNTMWLDRQNGILAVMGKLRSQPEAQRTQAIFFSKEKMWDQVKIRDWLTLHANYVVPVSVSQNASERINVLENAFVKQSADPTVPVNDVIGLIESVLPSPIIQRSWGLGPQRMCQELRRVILKLRKIDENFNHRGE
jgi:hypothetical protein